MKVFKNGNLMVITDDRGFIDSEGDPATGLFLEDTRFLSKLLLKSSIVLKRMRPTFSWDGVKTRYLGRISHESLHYDLEILEEMRCDGNRLTVSLITTNYSPTEAKITMWYETEESYDDILIVRSINDSYIGIDLHETTAMSTLRNSPPDSAHSKNIVNNRLPSESLKIGGRETVHLSGELILERQLSRRVVFKEILQDRRVQDIAFETDQYVKDRDIEDLKMLMIPTVYGDFPGAGIPWFATVFGRDSAIFGLQTLDKLPSVSRTILSVLSRLQSMESNVAQESSPGKIIHEARLNELSISGKAPFESYYGSIDATLLFLILLYRYYALTNNKDFVCSLEKHIFAAAEWIDNFADIDGDGYVEFFPSGEGLLIQGWKDSSDSVSFACGKLATSPLALVEVQGYLYDTYICLDKLMSLLNQPERGNQYLLKAQKLKKVFNKDFWLEEQKYFAVALDGHKVPVDSITSNPGYCLFTGIVDDEKAEFVVDRLFSEELYSGWGIRTLSNKMARYNPFSYHNGSVWPHDNSLILLGLLRYGYIKKARKLADDLLRAREKYHEKRLPEVISGLSVEESGGEVVEYPASCSPQLWSLGTIFTISQALDA